MELFELKVRNRVPAGCIRTVVVHAGTEKQARITANKETGQAHWQDNRISKCYQVGDFRCVVEQVRQS
jgi:hypothetical protein